ncbi:MAG: hypothetical protein EOP49_44525 [Sphingobacteriales bacterium]|nr:MAG: hypothetical protein EOP49_44525 [Sphingobacteriales bacterium]
MASSKKTNAQRWLRQATLLEGKGELTEAIRIFAKAASADPSNIRAWQRQLVLYRKTKSRKEEIKLVISAIASVKKARADQHEQWTMANKEKVESSRALAASLGLLGDDGMPIVRDAQLERWESRLYLLQHRESVARKKPKTKKKN